jgi:hypothetical protein
MYDQLDFEVMFRRPKRKGIPPNFHVFWSEEFHYKIPPPKNIFDIRMLEFHGFHGMMDCDFLGLIPNKVICRSYNHFPKILYFDFSTMFETA